MSKLTESVVEQAALDWLGGLGCETLSGLANRYNAYLNEAGKLIKKQVQQIKTCGLPRMELLKSERSLKNSRPVTNTQSNGLPSIPEGSFPICPCLIVASLTRTFHDHKDVELARGLRHCWARPMRFPILSPWN